MLPRGGVSILLLYSSTCSVLSPMTTQHSTGPRRAINKLEDVFFAPLRGMEFLYRMGRGHSAICKLQRGTHLRRRVRMAAHGPSCKDGAPTPLLRWQSSWPAHHRSRGRRGRGAPLALFWVRAGWMGRPALWSVWAGLSASCRRIGDSVLASHGGGAGDGFRKKGHGLSPSPRLPRCGVTRVEGS